MSLQVDADWKKRLYTAEQWKAMGRAIHIMFADWDFISQHNIEWDELHIIHLGTNKELLGSILWMLIYEIMVNSPLDNMDELWEFIQDYYKEANTPVNYSDINIRMFCDPKKP